MISTKPASPKSRIAFKIGVRATSLVILALVSLTLCGSGRAQDSQPQPVARLISSPVEISGFSRARRVVLRDVNSDSAAANEAVAPPAASLEDANTVERRAFAATNQARNKNGLQSLVWDADLCRMAREHSERMARLRYFSHETPEGLQLKQRARANGVLRFRVIAENIAYNKGYEDPGAFAVERWMISPGHRANILYVGFQASAIGSFVSADGSVYLTQVFIAR